MRWAVVRAIWLKELRETLRDRRTLFAMFVLPVLIHPLLFLLIGNVTAAESHKRKTLEPAAAVWGPLPPAVEAQLGKEIGLRIIDRREHAPADAVAQARALVFARKAELVLVIPDGAPELLAKDGGAPLHVYYDSTDDRSDSAETRIRKALTAWSDGELAARLQRHGLPAGFARPLDATREDLASKHQRAAEIAGRALPMVLLFVMVTCGLLPAIDLTAGEKERGTLQTLLCAPVRASEIVAGKYLTVVLVSVIGAAANLAAMAFALTRQLAAVSDELELSIRLSTALGLFAAMLPGALLLSAVLLGAGVFARSFREAQSYLTPIMLLVLMPAMITFFPGVELSPATALVPISNMALLARALLAGTASTQIYFIVTIANLAYAVAAILLTARIFETEQVLLSGERPWRDVFGRRTQPTRTPSARAAVLFTVVILVLNYYLALSLVKHHVPPLPFIVLNQLGVFLVPAVVWALAGKHDLRETFSLRLPTPRAFVGTLLLAAGCWAYGQLWGRLAVHLFGAEDIASELTKFFLDGGRPVLIAVALLPALAEEASFRGLVMAGLAGTGSRVTAIAGSALLFGLAHVQPARVMSASAMGMLLGWATLESGSLLCGAIVHAANNGLRMFVLAHEEWGDRLEQPSILFLGLASTVLGLALLRGSRRLPQERGADQ